MHYWSTLDVKRISRKLYIILLTLKTYIFNTYECIILKFKHNDLFQECRVSTLQICVFFLLTDVIKDDAYHSILEFNLSFFAQSCYIGTRCTNIQSYIITCIRKRKKQEVHTLHRSLEQQFLVSFFISFLKHFSLYILREPLLGLQYWSRGHDFNII